MKWSELAIPWQVCWEEAWAAWRAGSLFIGAAITDGAGQVIARGRNHIFDTDACSCEVCANQLAHAELNALLWLNGKPADVHSYHIYTLVEPCPLCMGAIYMSGVRAIHYAARDPWAGSTNLLGATPYLSQKQVAVYPPDLPALERMVVAMGVCFDRLHHAYQPVQPNGSVFIDALREILPEAVQAGERLAAERIPARWRADGLETAQVFEELNHFMK